MLSSLHTKGVTYNSMRNGNIPTLHGNRFGKVK